MSASRIDTPLHRLARIEHRFVGHDGRVKGAGYLRKRGAFVAFHRLLDEGEPEALQVPQGADGRPWP